MSDSTLPKTEGYLETFDPELHRAFEFADQEVDPSLVDHSKIKMHAESLKLSGDAFFYTLQGEGPTMGCPAIFVRLHVCNLKCSWCDAWYTWNPHTEEFWTEMKDVPVEEAAQQIHDEWAGPKYLTRRVIWTGGEPLIQRKQLDAAMKILEDIEPGIFYTFEIETNGTLMPTERQLERCQFNCSPKLDNSDNRDGSRIKPKILSALNDADSSFKFVCMTEEDLDEVERDFAPHIDHDKIIIMPQGITEEEVSMNAKRLAEPCKERGLRLMPRLQNICWDGARRGV